MKIDTTQEENFCHRTQRNQQIGEFYQKTEYQGSDI